MTSAIGVRVQAGHRAAATSGEQLRQLATRDTDYDVMPGLTTIKI